MTPTLISAFLTYTLITALTPGPNNILALSSVTPMVYAAACGCWPG